MTMRIDTTVDGPVVTLHLSGRVSSREVDALRSEMGKSRGTEELDLEEVTLVDVEVVRFLKQVERCGIRLQNCPPFIREWIERE